MGTSTREKTQGLTTQAKELTKQFIVYDGNGRPITIYTAGIGAETGTPCTRVDYEYLSPTSNSITKMRETVDVWDVTYDL